MCVTPSQHHYTCRTPTQLNDAVRHRTPDYRLPQIAYTIFVPTLFIIGPCCISQFAAFTLVNDRFCYLRYILHFYGNSSQAYVCGITAADSLLVLLPNVLFILLGIVFGIHVFHECGMHFLFIVSFFSLPFVQMCNLFGFIFKNPANANKSMVLPFLILWYIG